VDDYGCKYDTQVIVNKPKFDSLPGTGENPFWNYWNYRPGYWFNHTEATLTDCGHVIFDSAPFTALDPVAGESAGVQSLALLNDYFTVPDEGQLLLTCRYAYVATNVTNTYGQQLFGPLMPDPESDLRPSIACIDILDLTSGIGFSFVTTNRKIYVHYTRFAANLVSEGVMNFQVDVPVMDTCPGKYHDYAILLDDATKSASFFIDGKKVYQIYNSGFLSSDQFITVETPGNQSMFFPKQYQLVFIVASFMSAYSPCNIQQTNLDGSISCVFPQNDKGLVQHSPSAFYVNPRNPNQPGEFLYDLTQQQYTNYGQGGILSMTNLFITTRTPQPDCSCLKSGNNEDASLLAVDEDGNVQA